MIYQFKNYLLDTKLYRLEQNGMELSVEPQVFDLLIYLIKNYGRVVTREELLDNLWPGRVVSDSALNARLKSARKAVGDSGKNQSVIKTIHGRGYQFVTPVTESTQTVSDNPTGQPMFSYDRKPKVSGGCMCGNVRYEINQPAIGTGYCHCRMCQRFYGTPFSVWAAFPPESVQFVACEPKYYDSSLIAKRGFCENCGTALTYKPIAPHGPARNYLVIATATLDHPEDFPPTWHTGVESQLPWLRIDDDLPKTRCDESPDFNEAWESVGIFDLKDWK